MIKRPHLALLSSLALAAGATLLWQRPVGAQLDPGNFCIVQDEVQVGEIFTPVRNPGAPQYVEHWVLYPGYRYPSRENRLKVTVQPCAHTTYSSEQDFFARVPFATGSRYVRVDARESTTLPGH